MVRHHIHIPDMTYNVFGGTLSLTQSIIHMECVPNPFQIQLHNSLTTFVVSQTSHFLAVETFCWCISYQASNLGGRSTATRKLSYQFVGQT